MIFDKYIDRGIGCLDGIFRGRSWLEKINLDRLSMGNCKECVLGQIYGHFDNAPEFLSGTIDDPESVTMWKGEAYGFWRPQDMSQYDYDVLTAAWQHKLKELMV